MQNPQTIAQTAQHVLTGATLGGGVLEWLTVNSSAVTAMAVVATAISSIGIGIWNGKTNSDRNKLNRRDITESIVSELIRAGKSEDYINDLLLTIRHKRFTANNPT